jgi:hypothetical protein
LIKKLIPVIIILMLFCSSIAGTELVKKVNAFPPYDSSAESSITIDVSTPEQNKLYNTKNLTLNLNVSVGGTTENTLISSISYETDWEKESKTIFSYDGYFLRELMVQLCYPRTFKSPICKSTESLELTDIPEGNHSIKIYVKAWRYSSIEKLKDVFEYYLKYTDLTMANRTTTVSFMVDSVSPKIMLSYPMNITYDSRFVSVNFTVDELFSKCQYSLDGQENVTIAGNFTLEGLLDGAHNLTLFATDAAGNIGSSKTTYFTVDVPEPPVVSIIAIASIVIGISLLVYFKKRKH